MTGDEPSTGRSSLSRAALILGASTLGASGLAVVFQVVVSRLLGPSSYGALGALIALTVIVGVPGLAMQVVVARHTALRDNAGLDVHDLWASALRLVLFLSIGILMLTAALASVLMRFLHLSSIVPVLWLAVFCAVVPGTSVLQGILQGRERFEALASVLVVTAATRFISGYLLALAFGVSGALAGAAAGVSVGFLLAVRAARPEYRRRTSTGVGVDRDIGRELVRAGLCLAALTLLVFLDQTVARHYLTRQESGLYAVGALVAGALFWGSAFAGWAVFPRLVVSSETDRIRILGRTSAFITALCLAAIVVVAVTPRPTLRSLFGHSYTGLGASLWLFVAAGTAHSLLQLLVLSDIGRARPSRIAGIILLGVAAKTTLIATLFHGSVRQIATVVLLTSVLVLAIAISNEMPSLASWRRDPSFARKDSG